MTGLKIHPYQVFSFQIFTCLLSLLKHLDDSPIFLMFFFSPDVLVLYCQYLQLKFFLLHRKWAFQCVSFFHTTSHNVLTPVEVRMFSNQNQRFYLNVLLNKVLKLKSEKLGSNSGSVIYQWYDFQTGHITFIKVNFVF